MRSVGLLLVALVAGGCVEPDLGDIPFLCNNGAPRCPEGYDCVEQGGKEICLRHGFWAPTDTTSVVQDGPATPQDSQSPWAEDASVTPDVRPTPDLPQHKWDLGPVDAQLDQWTPTYDNGVTPFLCQTNADCTSPSEPCCCPMPLVPLVSVCISFCLDPLCF